MPQLPVRVLVCFNLSPDIPATSFFSLNLTRPVFSYLYLTCAIGFVKLSNIHRRVSLPDALFRTVTSRAAMKFCRITAIYNPRSD